MNRGLFEHCCRSTGPDVAYISSAMRVITAFLYVVPGFAAGFIARSRGILVGFLTGVIGGTVDSALSTATLLHVSSWDELASISRVVSLLSGGVVWSISCAGAGGAGQLVRSNNRRSGRDVPSVAD
jgi:ABC-type dipeptide/oligopeptide/nickel transport system permease subunit